MEAYWRIKRYDLGMVAEDIYRNRHQKRESF